MHRIDNTSSESARDGGRAPSHAARDLQTGETGSALWEFFVARIASPGVRHFLRESSAARAALQTKLDRACAADSLAGLGEWSGAIAGGAVLFLLLAFASGCGVEARDEGGEQRVFAHLDSARTAAEVAPDAQSPERYEWPSGEHRHAFLEVAGLGTIEIEMLPELAPVAVANFEKLASESFFDATYFHRVIPGFMVQAGDPNTRNEPVADDGQGGPGYTIDDEFSDAPHVRGVVAMANTGIPDSSGSQFFIVHETSHHLDGKYTVFGRVVSGMEVVDMITRVKTDKAGRWGPRDRPLEGVELSRVWLEPAPPAAPGSE